MCGNESHGAVEKLGQSLPLLPEIKERLIHLESVDSTNSYLKKLAADGVPHGTVVIADRQTDGRGRLGRQFESPCGGGVYMSMLLRPECVPQRALSITAATAVAVCNAIKDVTSCQCGIKWTNDIILGGKKICGILTEMSTDSNNKVLYIVVGVGVNANTPAESFSPEIRDIAGSLSDHIGKQVDRAALVASMIKNLDEMFLRWLSDEKWCLSDYRRLCINIGQDAIIKQTGEHIHVLDVNDDFSLEVRTSLGGVKRISSGEVSLSTPDGRYV